jgi:parvulin-like peptidyl-prolyl isomerase
MAELRISVWIRNLAIAGVILAFVVLFGQPSGGRRGSAVAKVGSEQVSREVFEFFREQNEETSRQFLPDNLDADTLRNMIDRQTLDALLRRYILAQQAQVLGLRVTDAEVAAEIRADQGFRVGGTVDQDRIERFANQLGGMRNYMQEVRRDLLLRKLQRIAGSPQRVPLVDAERRARRDALRIRLRYARARTSSFATRNEVTGDEARALADAEPDRVAELYRERAQEYRIPEQVRARHMLFQGDDAGERAAAALARLRAGEDFEALALELSEDAATREEGGDLGFFPRGRMLPGLEAVAFELGEGELSEPVETDRGVHLVRVEERQEASERSLEEVRFELARELVESDRARDAAAEAAETFLERLQEGAAYDDEARLLGLQVDVTPLIGWRDPLPPELASHPGLRGAAFELRREARVLDRVLASGDSFDVVWLVDREEPSEDEIASQALQLQEQLEREARGRLLGLWYRRRSEELQRSGELEVFSLYPAG